MRYRETLSWILDKNDNSMCDEDKYRANIDFVHSLGLKCDCVGWCDLNLDAPDAGEVLDKIVTFCREEGWQARGYYKREYCDIESDWYELWVDPCRIDNAIDWSGTKAPFEDGSKHGVPEVFAYKAGNRAPKSLSNYMLVSDRFRRVCLEHGIGQVDFCWVRDAGRYAGEQYFMIFADQYLPKVGCGKGLNIDRYAHMLPLNISRSLRYRQLGGSLPRLGKMFYDLQVQLPEVYLASDLPEGGIACAYKADVGGWNGDISVLVHRDAARILLQEKAVPEHFLRPVPVLQQLPEGYATEKRTPQIKPEHAYMDDMYAEYLRLMSKERPQRQATEKLALKQLRTAKRENPVNFEKALPKKQAELLAETAFVSLLPYYKVTSGGYISDEYRFLPPDAAETETQEFFAQLSREELLEEKPQGVVFAKCPDGDTILLQQDGRVCRFSHEIPEILDEWPSLAQFFMDETEIE